MRRYFQELKGDLHDSMDRLHGHGHAPTIPVQPEKEVETCPPRKEDWLKYRKHRGVNLGMSSTHVFSSSMALTEWRISILPQARGSRSNAG